ncbi:putative quinol monooxygenase [Heyndrickxia acidicola]|uniref:Antibiotic biosynthesis monooxygenase n=1 Tax=Heyndrickxia acidicola TaxID=209389 RepID=A0ABU6MLQ3_9BACI|nr:antibiotic biosynthesis monooxygenase [Heyndrickxia acidicola]MED1205327.1 antibiotic biosynthesis monooxygenase [Heyndrickxia acidicola]
MRKFGMMVRFIVKEGKRDTFLHILLGAARSMEELKECEMYMVSSSNDDPDSVFVYEIWSDEKAHQASLELESTQELIKQAQPLLSGVERAGTFTPEGGKGFTGNE